MERIEDSAVQHGQNQFLEALELAENGMKYVGEAKKVRLKNFMTKKDLAMVYSYGLEKGKQEERDRNVRNKLAMFHNVQTFLNHTDIKNPTYKDFKKWQEMLLKED